MAETLEQVRERFKWDAGTQRYRGPRGAFVSEKAMTQALRTYARNVGLRLEKLAGQVASGEITTAAWRERMAEQIKSLHLAQTAAARGGFEKLGQVDYGRIGQRLKGQYRYLDAFAREVARGKMPAAKIASRARQYAAAGSTVYENERRRGAAGVYSEERRILGDAEHCGPCVAQAGLGWQPLGTLSPIGVDTPCRIYCKCSFRFRDRPRREGRYESIGQWEKSLTPAERDAYQKWSGSWYSEVRAYQQTGEDRTGKAEQYSRAIERTLKTAPVHRGEAFRGIAGLDNAAAASLSEVGAIIDMRGTASFSATRPKAAKFAAGDNGLLFRVAISRTGVSIKGLSGIKGEAEVMMPRNARFRVVARTPLGNGRTLVDLEQVR